MKKSFIAAFAALAIVSAPAAALASDDITVTLDGRAIDFDVQPQIMNERTMVPLRAIFEALGADVAWDQATETVTAVKDDTTVSMTIGSNVIYVNQKPIELDIAPVIVDERTLVPVRAVAESFGSAVDWDGESRTVIIRSVVEKVISEAYQKLADSLKLLSKYDEATNTYTFEPDPLTRTLMGLNDTDVKTKYDAINERIDLVIGKGAADGLNVELTMSIKSDGDTAVKVNYLSGDKVVYTMSGNIIDGKLNVTESNLDDELYRKSLELYNESKGKLDTVLGYIGLKTSELGF